MDIATAGRRRGFSTINIKHNLFHQSTLGGDVELQNTHIVLFKSPRDVDQVATLGVQLDLDQLSLTGIGMQRLYHLVLCWLICLREQTIAYATAQKAEIFNQSFMYPKTWSIWNIWTMNALNLSTLQAFEQLSFACKIQFLKTCQKEFIRFLSGYIVNLLQGNLSEIKRSRVPNYRDKINELSLKRTTWKQRRSLLSFVAKRIISHKDNFPLRH